MAATRQTLAEYNGRHNVSKITSEDGKVAYLTESNNFGEVKNSLGATQLNTYESNTKHVLFLMDDDFSVLGKFYLGQKLQGKTPAQIAEVKHDLVFFESFNPTTSQWVPCVGLGSGNNLAEGAVAI